MKKILSSLSALLVLFALAGCSGKANIADKTITIGATPVPHAEILEAVRAVVEARGYELEIVVFTDYVLPDDALAAGELDANFFQHVPYLNSYNAAHGTSLVSAGAIHFEPLGLYAGTEDDLSAIPSGSSVAVPNDASNLARALLLLEANGLIGLADGAGLSATVLDIVSNPFGLEIVELEAAAIPSRLEDVAFAVINGNYAIEAGVTDRLLVSEAVDSAAADLYANIIAVRAGTENAEAIAVLLEALRTQAVRDFIAASYGVSVVPVF
ncbi:MAG: MetQ/NlpA family ABC transporter substrate-binding protein [Candidatus Izemoplasmatales bacterium]